MHVVLSGVKLRKVKLGKLPFENRGIVDIVCDYVGKESRSCFTLVLHFYAFLRCPPGTCSCFSPSLDMVPSHLIVLEILA